MEFAGLFWGAGLKPAMKAAGAATLRLALAISLASPADAACGLTLVGSYDIVDTQYGQIGINVKIGDETKLMLVDTGARFSFLTFATVGAIKLPSRSMGD